MVGWCYWKKNRESVKVTYIENAIETEDRPYREEFYKCTRWRKRNKSRVEVTVVSSRKGMVGL